MQIAVWPDGTWCPVDEASELLLWKSDDYRVVDLPSWVVDCVDTEEYVACIIV